MTREQVLDPRFSRYHSDCIWHKRIQEKAFVKQIFEHYLTIIEFSETELRGLRAGFTMTDIKASWFSIEHVGAIKWHPIENLRALTSDKIIFLNACRTIPNFSVSHEFLRNCRAKIQYSHIEAVRKGCKFEDIEGLSEFELELFTKLHISRSEILKGRLKLNCPQIDLDYSERDSFVNFMKSHPNYHWLEILEIHSFQRTLLLYGFDFAWVKSLKIKLERALKLVKQVSFPEPFSKYGFHPIVDKYGRELIQSFSFEQFLALVALKFSFSSVMKPEFQATFEKYCALFGEQGVYDFCLKFGGDKLFSFTESQIRILIQNLGNYYPNTLEELESKEFLECLRVCEESGCRTLPDRDVRTFY